MDNPSIDAAFRIVYRNGKWSLWTTERPGHGGYKKADLTFEEAQWLTERLGVVTAEVTEHNRQMWLEAFEVRAAEEARLLRQRAEDLVLTARQALGRKHG